MRHYRYTRSMRQAKARARYQRYIRSSRWRARRQAWVEQHKQSAIICAGCGVPWSLTSGDLHHLSYDRLGSERHSDLMALCRACHEFVETGLRANAFWRRMSLHNATLSLLRIRNKLYQ